MMKHSNSSSCVWKSIYVIAVYDSNSSNCVWNNITGIAVYWLICQTQLLWLLLLKHSNSSSYVWKSIDVIIVYRLICQTQLLWLPLFMSLLCIDLNGIILWSLCFKHGNSSNREWMVEDSNQSNTSNYIWIT